MAVKKKDHDNERLARIEALMEEYRVKHEDLVAYVEKVNTSSRRSHKNAQVRLTDARRHFSRSKRS